ncbi:MAG: hypothetical protein AAGD07_07370 [Planctomycetota bacterium]
MAAIGISASESVSDDASPPDIKAKVSPPAIKISEQAVPPMRIAGLVHEPLAVLEGFFGVSVFFGSLALNGAELGASLQREQRHLL